MGASIKEVLAESLLGPGTALEWDEVSRYTSTLVNSQVNTDRVARHRRRQEFYNDGGHSHVNALIDSTIQDKSVRELRKQWTSAAGFNNVTRRIVDARSTVYQDHAKRTVDGAKNNETYQQAQKAFRINERSRQWNRLANLHRTLLVQVRVRNRGSQDAPILQPRIDIITPAQIRALITSPKDPTRLEGAIIELAGSVARENTKAPHSVFWTNKEVGYLDDNGLLMAVPEEHGLDRMPLSLLQLDEDTDSLWSTFGESLISAHTAEWFCDLCLLKETKSATKQSILSGDMTSAARQQAADTEFPVEMPDGTAHSIVDMSMDLAMFRDTANHIVDTIASSHGIAPSILRHQGVQSAAARDLMRVPLRELRLEQQSPLREFERELAEVQSMVLARDMPELAFDTKGWSVDFADPQTPLSGKEQLEEYEHANRLCLTSPYKQVMKRNPDLTRKQAAEEIEENIKDKLEFTVLQRPFQELSGAMHGVPGEDNPAPITDSPPSPSATPPSADDIARSVLDAS